MSDSEREQLQQLIRKWLDRSMYNRAFFAMDTANTLKECADQLNRVLSQFGDHNGPREMAESDTQTAG